VRYNYTWFRWFHSTVRDAKLRDLPTDQRWVWPALLTLASESPTRGLIRGQEAKPVHIADVAAVPVPAVERALAAFTARQMIRTSKRGIQVLKFLERQYDKPSDRPQEVKKRVAKARATRALRPPAADVSPEPGASIANVTPQSREEERREDKPPSVVSPTINGKNGTRLTPSQLALVRHWNLTIARASVDQREKRTIEAIKVLSVELGYIPSEKVRQIMLETAKEVVTQ
jgi:hypothetical protein